jgi:DNA-binding MarR family transcriptional regulator
MSDISTKIPAAGKASKPAAEIDPSVLAGLVAGMSRLMFRLAALPPLKEAGLSLGEWIALVALAEKDGISNKQLANKLGVTRQRANQICASLSGDGLISISQSQEDSRMNVITLSDNGKAILDVVNSAILPLVASALKNKERSLAIADKQVRYLMRIANAGGSASERRTPVQG